MHEVAAIFAELGISQYLNDFLEQGFDTWETILDITESDFDALKVKLGHRRKLQRRIAETRRLSSVEDATASPKHHTPSEERQTEEHRVLATREDGKDKDKDNASASGAQGGKRKYRRHPKPDEHAPERPPSAYVLFSNKMRDDLKGRHLSFTEIAKLVGENWQNLPPSEKEPYEAQAFADKERYNQELAEYKKTEHYRNYNQYLGDFKAKQASQQSALEGNKRPKLEKSRSSGSGSNNSEVSSQPGGGAGGGGGCGDYSSGARGRMDSISSTSTGINGNQWASATHASPLGQLSHMQKPRISHASSGSEHNKSGHSSPPTTSPHPNSNVSLPGYRESMHAQTLPWRESPREHDMPTPATRLPPCVSSNPRRSYPIEAPNYPLQSPHSMGQSPSAPPLLSHESTSGTSRSSLSSASTNSSMYFQPRTPIGPLEPQVDRPQMPLPSLFPSKPGFYEGNQLPPLRPASLSPHNSLDPSFQTPLAPNVDYAMPPAHALRNYQRPSPPDSISGASTVPTPKQSSQQGHAQSVQQDPPLSNFQQGFHAGSAHALQQSHGNSDGRGFASEKEMDPMSALVRAGEIVSGNSSRERQQ